MFSKTLIATLMVAGLALSASAVEKPPMAAISPAPAASASAPAAAKKKPMVKKTTKTHRTAHRTATKHSH